MTIAIKDNLHSVQTNVNTIRAAQITEEYQAVLDWLSPTDFTAQQHDIIKRRAAGTAGWFTESSKFKSWEQGHHKTLFCCGMPGAGKTMMAAIAIDHICTSTSNDKIGLAYGFCNYKNQADQSALGLLSTILRHLVDSRPDLGSPLLDMHSQHMKRKTRPSLVEVTTALKTVCMGYDSSYIVVDALDEFMGSRSGGDSGRARFIHELRTLQTVADIRLLFTSRPIPEVTQLFNSDITLEVRAMDEDIQQFVASHVSANYDLVLKAEIVDKITVAADGMCVFMIPDLLMMTLTALSGSFSPFYTPNCSMAGKGRRTCYRYLTSFREG
jgi:hypothetical protein